MFVTIRGVVVVAAVNAIGWTKERNKSEGLGVAGEVDPLENKKRWAAKITWIIFACAFPGRIMR